MSLQGTLDTFSLPEILELVEKSRKTGALEVRDPQSRGVLYFAGGRFSAAEAGELAGPVESAEELEARLIDVCFALFRVETGLYEFESDRFPPWPVRGGSEVGPIIEQVKQLRRDWLAIEAILPSLECRPDVVDDLDGDRVVLDKAGFRVLRVVDGDRNVREIARAVGRSVLEVCKVLKDLVEAGAVTVPSDPAHTVVDELVLTADAAAVEPVSKHEAAYEPVAAPVVNAAIDPVSAAFPEPVAEGEHGQGYGDGYADGYADRAGARSRAEAGDDPDGLPELPAVPGLVVPSSPEGLTEDLDVRVPSDPHPSTGPGGLDDLREAEQYGEVPAATELPAEDRPEPDPVTLAGDGGRGDGGRADDERVEEDDDEEPAPDRGALLRMFSSLRDT